MTSYKKYAVPSFETITSFTLQFLSSPAGKSKSVFAIADPFESKIFTVLCFPTYSGI